MKGAGETPGSKPGKTPPQLRKHKSIEKHYTFQSSKHLIHIHSLYSLSTDNHISKTVCGYLNQNKFS